MNFEYTKNPKRSYCCYQLCEKELPRDILVITDPEGLSYCRPSCYTSEMELRRAHYDNDEEHPER